MLETCISSVPSVDTGSARSNVTSHWLLLCCRSVISCHNSCYQRGLRPVFKSFDTSKMVSKTVSNDVSETPVMVKRRSSMRRVISGSIQRNGSISVVNDGEVVTYKPAKFVVNKLDTGVGKDEESSDGGLPLTCSASNFVPDDDSRDESSNHPRDIQVVDLHSNNPFDVDSKESLSVDEDVEACNITECKYQGTSICATFFGRSPESEERNDSMRNTTRDNATREAPPPKEQGDVLDYMCEGVEGLVCSEGAATGDIVRDNSLIDDGERGSKVNSSAASVEKDRLEQVFEVMEGYICNTEEEVANEKDALDHVFEKVEGFACQGGANTFQTGRSMGGVNRTNSLITDSSASGSECSRRERIKRNGNLVDVEHGEAICEMNIVGQVRDASLLNENKVVPFHQSRCFLCLVFNFVLTTAGVVGVAVWWFLTYKYQ